MKPGTAGKMPPSVARPNPGPFGVANSSIEIQPRGPTRASLVRLMSDFITSARPPPRNNRIGAIFSSTSHIPMASAPMQTASGGVHSEIHPSDARPTSWFGWCRLTERPLTNPASHQSVRAACSGSQTDPLPRLPDHPGRRGIRCTPIHVFTCERRRNV